MKTPKTRFSLIKDAVWKRISRGIGDHLNKPNFLKNKALQLDIQDWSITIDSYTSNKTLHTRFRAPFINDEKLSIKIFTKGMLGSEMKFFGMQDIIVGHPDIDEKYIIQGNKNNILKGIFESVLLRKLMMDQKELLIQVKDDEGWFGEATKKPEYELYVEVPYLIKDNEQLTAVFTIFSEILSFLCDNSPAYFVK